MEQIIEEKSQLKAYSKCLILGGYSILFNGSIGTSIRLSDYFTSSYKLVPKEARFNVKVSTTQFLNQNPVEIFISHKKMESYNPFVEAAVKVTLNYLKNLLPKKYNEIFNINSLVIHTIQTSGFINKKYLKRYQENAEFPKYKDHMSVCEKTGIGSSACAIVIIIKTIFKLFYGEEEKLDHIHIISQISNSIV